MTWDERFVHAFNTISPIVLKTFVGCGMAVVLTLFYCSATWAAKPIDWLVFGEVCGFAAAFAGIAGWSFSTMRKTDYEYTKIKGEADAKVAAATKPLPAAPAPIVTQPAAAVEINP